MKSIVSVNFIDRACGVISEKSLPKQDHDFVPEVLWFELMHVDL